MAIGVVTVLLSPETGARRAAETEERRRMAAERADRAASPTSSAATRWQAALILSLIAVYRISDVVMGIMANPFYVDMGFTKDEVATVSKIYGVDDDAGRRLRRRRALDAPGRDAGADAGRGAERRQQPAVRRAGPRGHDLTALVLVVSADNLAGGIASAAFIAYLSSLTNISYSATQYALFSSLMLLLPKFIAGYSGVFVDAFGYKAFFIGTAALGLPVLLLVALASRAAANGKAAGQATSPRLNWRHNGSIWRKLHGEPVSQGRSG